MIREKRFYLKIRKQGVRWGCPCCSGPVGRDAKKKRARGQVTDRIRSGKLRENRIFAFLVDSESEE
jgi:hypothetical protein